MPLNMNIPLPELPGDTLRKAFATGSNMYSNIMNPIINRENFANQNKMQQERLVQQKQLQENQLAQQWKQHLDELALRKQQEARLGANSGLQSQILQQNLLKMQHANDPMWDFNNKMNQIKNLQALQANSGSQEMGRPQESQNYMQSLLQRGQELPQGGDALMQPQEQKQQGQGGQLPGGVNLDDIIRGLTYQAFDQKAPPKAKEPSAKDIATTKYMDKRANSFAYSTAPVDAKNYMLAQAAGMGIAPDKAVNAFTNGKTIEDLARENGFDPDNLPEPDFAPTRGNVTKLNDRKAALGEMKHLSDFVIKGLGPYSDTFMNWSPQQTLDQLNGMNKEKQIKFIAAKGISPELVNMRLMTAGARGTVHAIKSMQDKSLLNIKSLQSGVKPDVWQAAQRLMDKELEQAMNASMSKYRLKTKKEREGEGQTEDEGVQELNGKKYKKINGEWHELR